MTTELTAEEQIIAQDAQITALWVEIAALRQEKIGLARELIAARNMSAEQAKEIRTLMTARGNYKP